MDLDKIRKKLKNMKIFNYNLIFVLKTIATIIFVISMIIQMHKLISTKNAKDYSIYFILLQIIGIPEGGGGGIVGLIKNNIHLIIMGFFGFIYYCTALFIKLFYK